MKNCIVCFLLGKAGTQNAERAHNRAGGGEPNVLFLRHLLEEVDADDAAEDAEENIFFNNLTSTYVVLDK